MTINDTDSNSIPENTFIKGDSVYLRMPDIEKDIIQGHWHTWFNDPDITRYLVHGTYPIDCEGEASLIREELAKRDTLILSIIDKQSQLHIGVISLKQIDHINRTAEIGIVMGPQRNPLAAIESMSLLMKHAFDRLNLNLLYAGQHQDLWKWVNTLSLIGFRIDGFRRYAGVRNGTTYGSYLTSVCADEFYTLQESRNGKIMSDKPLQLLKQRNKKNPLAELDSTLSTFNTDWRNY